MNVMISEAAAHFDYWQRSGQDRQNVRQDYWPPLLRMARLIPAVEYIQVLLADLRTRQPCLISPELSSIQPVEVNAVQQGGCCHAAHVITDRAACTPASSCAAMTLYPNLVCAGPAGAVDAGDASAGVHASGRHRRVHRQLDDRAGHVQPRGHPHRQRAHRLQPHQWVREQPQAEPSHHRLLWVAKRRTRGETTPVLALS